MFKSKLQELCQKQKWERPIYTCVKDGNDDCPQFKASVVVRGVSFDTPSPTNSSKRALNEAAQLAFLHFTSQPSDQKTNHGIQVESSKPSEGFKNKLMMYAQRKGLKKPVYCTEKEGQYFKARVSVGEDWFTNCDELYATATEAENAAAATVLLALLTDEFNEVDPCSYKILLKNLASDQGTFPPTYKTTRCDDSVSCTVEIEGEAFEGDADETHKLAELNAAKAAYTALVERNLFQPCDEILKLARRFDSAAISDPPPQGQKTTGEKQETDHHMKKDAKMKSCYLLCNKIRVFRSVPNMALPDGMVVLPIAENRWAIVALEFHNEKAV